MEVRPTHIQKEREAREAKLRWALKEPSQEEPRGKLGPSLLKCSRLLRLRGFPSRHPFRSAEPAHSLFSLCGHCDLGKEASLTLVDLGCLSKWCAMSMKTIEWRLNDVFVVFLFLSFCLSEVFLLALMSIRCQETVDARTRMLVRGREDDMWTTPVLVHLQLCRRLSSELAFVKQYLCIVLSSTRVARVA